MLNDALKQSPRVPEIFPPLDGIFQVSALALHFLVELLDFLLHHYIQSHTHLLCNETVSSCVQTTTHTAVNRPAAFVNICQQAQAAKRHCLGSH